MSCDHIKVIADDKMIPDDVVVTVEPKGKEKELRTLYFSLTLFYFDCQFDIHLMLY